MSEGTGFTSYQVDNDRKFQKAMEATKLSIGDLTIPLSLIATDFYRGQRAIFNLKSPGKYPPLSRKPFFAWWEPKGSSLRTTYLAGYTSYKAAKYGSAYPILKATGRLQQAAAVRGGAGNITIVTPDSLTLGVSEGAVPYAKYHQSDEPRRGKLPQRKFFFIGPEAPRFANSSAAGRLSRWTNILRGHVVKTLTNVWGAA